MCLPANNAKRSHLNIPCCLYWFRFVVCSVSMVTFDKNHWSARIKELIESADKFASTSARTCVTGGIERDRQTARKVGVGIRVLKYFFHTETKYVFPRNEHDPSVGRIGDLVKLTVCTYFHWWNNCTTQGLAPAQNFPFCA